MTRSLLEKQSLLKVPRRQLLEIEPTCNTFFDLVYLFLEDQACFFQLLKRLLFQKKPKQQFHHRGDASYTVSWNYQECRVPRKHILCFRLFWQSKECILALRWCTLPLQLNAPDAPPCGSTSAKPEDIGGAEPRKTVSRPIGEKFMEGEWWRNRKKRLRTVQLQFRLEERKYQPCPARSLLVYGTVHVWTVFLSKDGWIHAKQQPWSAEHTSHETQETGNGLILRKMKS